MIKYYDTLAAYEAAVKSASESQASFVEEGRQTKFDGRNVCVGIKSARTGAIVMEDENAALHFIAPGTYTKDYLDSGWTIDGIVAIGVDSEWYRGQIGVIPAIEPPSHKILTTLEFTLTGFTLDGTERTGTLVTREKADNYQTNHEHVITYTASTIDEFVATLNAYFQDTPALSELNFCASAKSDTQVIINVVDYTHSNQHYQSGKDGFSLSDTTASGWKSSIVMPRRNGWLTYSGCVTNYYRALAVFKSDTSDTSYNPSTDVTSIARQFPVCLPAYLGTSKYQSDHCALLREHYGEGEEGWKKHVASCLPLLPSDRGINNDEKVGSMRENNTYMASLKHHCPDGTEAYSSPAARYAAEYGFSNALLAPGQWMWTDFQHGQPIIGSLKYPSEGGRDSDKINAALQLIGAPALGNNLLFWFLSRWNASDSWNSYGYYGRSAINWFGASYRILLLALLDVAEGNS